MSASVSTLSPRDARANLGWVSAAHAVIHATSVLMPLVYIPIKQQYHFSYTEIGLLVTVPSLVSGLLQLVFGYLGRWVTRKAMIGVGNLVVGLGIALTGLANSFALFLGWGVVRSVGSAPQHPVGSSLLSDTYPKSRRGFALAAHVAGGNIGTLAVPALGGYLINQFGWRPAVMLFALPGLLAGAGVLMFVREPALGASRRPQPAPAGESAPEAPQTGSSRWQTLISPLRHRGVVLIIIASMVAAGGRGLGVLTTYFPLYLTNKVKFDGRTVTVLFTILLVGSVFGPLVAGRLSDSFGRRGVLYGCYGLGALFTVVLPLLFDVRAPVWVYLVEVVLLGLSVYAESPILQAFLADSAPDTLRDRAFGWYFTLAFGIGSLWGTALGWLIDHVGFQTTFFVMAGSYLAAALILAAVPVAGKRHSRAGA